MGARLGWLPAQKDGSVGAGARAALPHVSQRSAGLGTCPADGRLCSQRARSPGQMPNSFQELGTVRGGLLKQQGLSYNGLNHLFRRGINGICIRLLTFC